MGEPISDDRLRNTRAWAVARIGQLSGAEVIVAACDEALAAREAAKSGIRYETIAPRPFLPISEVVIGQEYWWMAESPSARCRVVVDEIRCEPNGDVMVFTTTLEGDGVGLKTWNDMSRFQEACTRVRLAPNTGAGQ